MRYKFVERKDNYATTYAEKYTSIQEKENVANHENS